MKILQIVHSFPPHAVAGTEIYTYNLSRELAKRNEVFIFHRVCNIHKAEYDINCFQNDGIEIFTINNTFRKSESFDMIYRNDTIAQKFSETLDKIQPDIVHIQHLLFLSTSLVYEIKKKGIPIVFTLHDYWLMCPKWFFLKNDKVPCSYNDKNECVGCLREQISIKKIPKRIYFTLRRILPFFALQFLKHIYLGYESIRYLATDEAQKKVEMRRQHIKEMCSLIDVFIAPSYFLSHKYEQSGILHNNVLLIPHGLDKNRTNNFEKCSSTKIRFGFIGTILPAKGVDILIKAFMKTQNENAELKIYGKLYPYKGFEHYPSYIKGLAKSKNVRFMGEFENRDIPYVFTEIDMLVVPSIWEEPYSLVIREAFLMKTPVIASNIGAIPEFIIHGVNGLLCKPKDIEDMKEKLEYVIDNPEIINKFKHNIPFIKSIEENAKEIEEIYTTLLSKKDDESKNSY